MGVSATTLSPAGGAVVAPSSAEGLAGRDEALGVSATTLSPAGARAVRRHALMSAYHGAMRRKYEAAGRSPWLPVGPDPPEPEGIRP